MTRIVQISLGLAVAVTSLAALGSAAQAGFPGYKDNRLPYYAAYDPLWKLKNPGGPVEYFNRQAVPASIFKNGFGLTNPGVIRGFNPQPDPPGFN